ARPAAPYGLRNGVVIVADAYNCRVRGTRGRGVIRWMGRAGHCVHDPPRYLGPVNGDTPLPNGHILVSEINGSYLDEFTMTGKLVRVYHAPVAYPSDPQLARSGNILLADYASPGGVVILSRRTGRLLWRYQPASGPGPPPNAAQRTDPRTRRQHRPRGDHHPPPPPGRMALRPSRTLGDGPRVPEHARRVRLRAGNAGRETGSRRHPARTVTRRNPYH